MMRPLAALLALLALAACGGDDGASPSPTPSAATTATPAVSPRPSPAPGEIVEQLAYIGPDGEIRLVNADGSGDHVLSDSPCDAGDSVNVKYFIMSWSPDGSALAFMCVSDLAPRQTLSVVNSDGKQVASVQDISGFRWSPDSTRLAYQRSAEPDGVDVGLLDVGTGSTRTLRSDALLMEWVGPGSLLLGLEPVFGDFATAFKAHLIDLASGGSTAFPQFDNSRALWVSPDGARAIVQTDQRDPNGSAPGMAVYNFATGLETVIDGGHIGYPSDFIPHEQLAFSPDGATIYWANAADASASIWEARVDAPEARKLGEAGSLFVVVSPLGRVAEVAPPQEAALGTIAIEDFAAGTRVEVGRGSFPFAWCTVVH
jgi:dipeptidyl aminopeptidase/acylaminoacyl peptidase